MIPFRLGLSFSQPGGWDPKGAAGVMGVIYWYFIDIIYKKAAFPNKIQNYAAPENFKNHYHDVIALKCTKFK